MEAKPNGTRPTVNAALVHRQFAFLPGEICCASGGGADSQTRIGSPRATKNRAPWRAARRESKKEAATCQTSTARRVATRGVTQQKSAKAIPEIDEWIRRRIRMCYWKQWRLFRTRIRNLKSLGVSPDNAIKHGVSSLNYWRMSRSPVVQQALSNAWLKAQGVVSVKDLWCKAQGYT